MSCSTDAPQGFNTITWRYDGAQVVSIGCVSSDISRFNISSSTTNVCNLIGHANAVTGNQGPYHCSDGTAGSRTAEALAILIDSKSSCGVITSPPIRGQSVTLSCSVSYITKADEVRVNPGATVTASTSWGSAAGTVSSTTNTPIESGGNTIGETKQVDVTQVASGNEIPSYTCTTSFSFADQPSNSFSYALNSLTWPCTSPAVLTWYCPSSVTVSPTSGPFETGNVLTCTAADGYPEPSFSWTDKDGAVVSSASTMTILNPGDFNFTCTATGNFTTPCSASSSVTGTATGEVVTTTVATTTVSTSGGGDGGNGTDTSDTPPTGVGIGTIIGAVVGALAALLLAGLIIGLLVARRRKDDDDEGRPRESIAFYQAVRAGRPAMLACPGKYNRPWMIGAYRPRCIDNQPLYGQYCGPPDCGPAYCYSPRYSQQSVPMSPIFY